MFLLSPCDLDLVYMKTFCDSIIFVLNMGKVVRFLFWESMLDFVAMNKVSQEGNLLVQVGNLFFQPADFSRFLFCFLFREEEDLFFCELGLFLFPIYLSVLSFSVPLIVWFWGATTDIFNLLQLNHSGNFTCQCLFMLVLFSHVFSLILFWFYVVYLVALF